MESHIAALSIRELKKSFGEINAVDGVSFDVQEGELYGLLGPNGAGKTTTISMMSGLIRPDGGQVRVLGKDFWSDPKTAQTQTKYKQNSYKWGRALQANFVRNRSNW